MQELRKLEADALTAQKAGNWGAAAEIWATIVTVQPKWEHGYPYYHLADCYTRLGQLDAAEEAYRKAISTEPGNPMFAEALEALVDARKRGHI